MLSLEGSFPCDDREPCDCIEPVLDAIASLTSLTYLNLSELHYREYLDWMIDHQAMTVDVPEDVDFGKRLGPMLCSLKHLQHLDLTRYHVAEDISESIVDAIGSLANLRVLNLTEVTEEESFWELFAGKVAGLCELQEVFLSRNDSITNLNIGELASSLAELPKLEALEIDQCEIEREGMIEFAQCLSSMTALRVISLKNNRISPQGAKALAESLKGMTQLKSVMLCKGDIGSEGEAGVVEAVQTSCGEKWADVLDVVQDYDEWDSDNDHGEGTDEWEGMDVAQIEQLLAAAEEALPNNVTDSVQT